MTHLILLSNNQDWNGMGIHPSQCYKDDDWVVQKERMSMCGAHAWISLPANQKEMP